MTKYALSFLFVSFLAAGCGNKASVQSSDTSHASSSVSADSMTHPVPPVNVVLAGPAFDAKKVSIHNLPDSVRPFVSKYYPDYRIAAASYDPLCDGAPAMDIAIRAKGKPAYSVIFLPNGHYVQREQDIPLSSVSAGVKSALKQKYASYRPGRQAERLELVDGTREYSVDLNKPHNNKEAIFSESGDVLCEGPQ